MLLEFKLVLEVRKVFFLVDLFWEVLVLFWGVLVLFWLGSAIENMVWA